MICCEKEWSIKPKTVAFIAVIMCCLTALQIWYMILTHDSPSRWIRGWGAFSAVSSLLAAAMWTANVFIAQRQGKLVICRGKETHR